MSEFDFIIQALRTAKHSIIEQFDAFGKKHAILKYPMFVFFVAFLFSYNFMLQLMIQAHRHKRFSKALACILSVLLVISNVNIIALADDTNIDPQVIAFDVLSAEIVEQNIYVGDDESSISFPTYLNVTLEKKETVTVQKEIEKSELPSTDAINGNNTEKDNSIVEESNVPVSSNEDITNNNDIQENQLLSPDEVAEEPCNESTVSEETALPENSPKDSDQESDDTTKEPASTDQAKSLINRLFPATIVYAAESTEELSSETEYETVTEEVTTSEDAVIMVSSWYIAPELSSSSDFSSEHTGAKYVYLPTLDTSYNIVAPLPQITVTVLPKEEFHSSVAFSYSETVSGYNISITAAEGIFPNGTAAFIGVVSNPITLIEGEIPAGRNIQEIVTFDISFWHEGIEIEPENGSVNVSINLASDMKKTLQDENAEVQVFHIDDDKSIEEIACSTNGEAVSFSADSFSEYSVVTTSGNSKTKLNTPTNVHWVDGETITLAWDSVENASYYEVGMKVDSNTGTTWSSTVSGTSLDLGGLISSYENYNSDANGKIIYAFVKARVNTSDSSKYLLYYDSDDSEMISKVYQRGTEKIKLNTPTNVHWVDGETITLAWDSVENASYYEVGIKVGNNTGTTWSSTVSGTSLDLGGLISSYENYNSDANGKTIYAFVKARVNTSDSSKYLYYYDSNDSEMISKVYQRGTEKTKLNTPTNVHWVDGETITLAWDSVENASYYEVGIKVGNNTGTTWSSTVSGTSLDLGGLISSYENYNSDANGKIIYAFVKARVNTSDSSKYLYYYDSSDSEMISKTYIRQIVINSEGNTEIVQTDAIYDSLRNSLTQEQLAAAEGKELSFDLAISQISASSAGASDISNYATNNSYTVAQYFDISLIAKADGVSIGSITATAAAVPMAVEIPTGLQKPGRTFIILRNHDGVITEVGRGTGNQVPISTDQFSTYAIAYQDESSSGSGGSSESNTDGGSSSGDSNSSPSTNNSSSSSNNSSNNTSSSSSSSSESSTNKWAPKTPDEIKRYSVVGTEQITPFVDKSSGFSLTIKNTMQGPNCYAVFESMLNGFTIGRTYDIYPNGQKVQTTDKEIAFSFEIPKVLLKEGRTYQMICVSQNGQPVILKDLDTKPNTITIKTNKFYAFALVYKDQKTQ